MLATAPSLSVSNLTFKRGNAKLVADCVLSRNFMIECPPHNYFSKDTVLELIQRRKRGNKQILSSLVDLE